MQPFSEETHVARYGGSGVVVFGDQDCHGTLRLREFLNRNGQPYSYVDLKATSGLLPGSDGPLVVCHGVLLRRPTLRQLADCLGLNDGLDKSRLFDVVVAGAGPSGLAAAVYAASEGLAVLVLESCNPGGQAASSSRIENYLGFLGGISGQDLAETAIGQARKFGAAVAVAHEATALDCVEAPYTLTLTSGETVRARSVIVATGARYRRPDIPNLRQFEGVGIYYAATFMEAQLCRGEEIAIVGGGNSAGQAAVFLAQYARLVNVLVRRSSLVETMSKYLIDRIEATPNIKVRAHTEITNLEGDAHLEWTTWYQPAVEERIPIRHVFVMTGAEPNTKWLLSCPGLELDEHGFVRTGADVVTPAAGRRPQPLETSQPGVFAVGDVRSGNVKRVASAVGEGSVAVSYVHRFLEGK
jgi:thioredoxin reductase (NADPH)